MIPDDSKFVSRWKNLTNTVINITMEKWIHKGEGDWNEVFLHVEYPRILEGKEIF